MTDTKAEDLLRWMARLSGGRALEAVGGVPGLERYVAAAGGSEDVARAVDAMRAGRPVAPDDRRALEAIVHRTERPVFDVRGDRVCVDEAEGVWAALREPEVRARLDAVVPAVGRIDVRDAGGAIHTGTGFLVGPDLVLTNRHVALTFCVGSGPARMQLLERVVVDLVRERVPRDGVVLDVVEVVLLHPFWDVAILRVSGVPAGRRPLRLVAAAPGDLGGRRVAVFGGPDGAPGGGPAGRRARAVRRRARGRRPVAGVVGRGGAGAAPGRVGDGPLADHRRGRRRSGGGQGRSATLRWAHASALAAPAAARRSERARVHRNPRPRSVSWR